MIATVSPRPMPRAASPAAIFSTRCAYSAHVIENSSPFVRMAGWSARSSAVSWKASAIVLASSARGV